MIGILAMAPSLRAEMWTRQELEARGAKVEKFIKDPAGPHGGFMNPQYLEPSLDLAEQFVSK